MSVFYKFKSAKDYDTIAFEGTSISLGRLKQSIATQKKLPKTMDYDLVLENAQTGEVYKYEQDMVPKNTSILVKRVPLARSGASANNNPSANSSQATTMPTPSNATSSNATIGSAKSSLTGSVFSRSTSGSSNPSGASFSSVFSGAASANQPQQSNEDERLKAMLNATEQWIPETSSQQHHHSQARRIPPPNYICHRCKKSGHYIQNCPTNGDPKYDIKKIPKATGIPKSFLKLVEDPKPADLNGALVMPGGGLARVELSETDFSKAVGKRSDLDLKDIPKEFQCPLCLKSLTDAVKMPCCKTNYCNNCITHTLIHDTNFTCPNCKSPKQTIDALQPNIELRNRVDRYKLTLDRDLANVPATTDLDAKDKQPILDDSGKTSTFNNAETNRPVEENKQSFSHSRGSVDRYNKPSNRDNFDRRDDRRDDRKGGYSQQGKQDYKGSRDYSYDRRDDRRDDRRGDDRRDYNRRDDRRDDRRGDKRDRYDNRPSYDYDRKKRKD